jgi:hypothetical protein
MMIKKYQHANKFHIQNKMRISSEEFIVHAMVN